MKFWYRQGAWQAWLLLPLSGVFWLLSSLRRGLYRLGLKSRYRPPVPVLVVGNLSVGGNGKTPVVLALAKACQQAGIKAGIISRGYGGKGPFPALVSSDSEPAMVGDEALLLASRSGLPMAVAPHRQTAVERLLAEGIELIIADDGLQHYALDRDLELVVIDGQRRFGNGWLLPAGPLRETPARLNNVDYVVINGGVAETGEYAMCLNQGKPRRVLDDQEVDWATLGDSVSAIAGIGNPERFFASLRQRGLHLCCERPFADHHPYCETDFQGLDGPLLMTEKDAVKCRKLAQDDWYYVPVDATFSPDLCTAIIDKLRSRHGL